MRRFLIFGLLLLLLAGCTNISSLLSTPEPAPVSTNTPPPFRTPTATLPASATPNGPRTLRIWVPARFDPAAETQAGSLLQARLDEFVARRPGLRIEVRVKAESGPTGLLNALSATRSAAPSIMPDLVALSRADLEAATTKGMLHPLDGLTTLPDDPDWYPYARQIAHIQNTIYGLPFAGDALVLIGYRYPLPAAWSDLTKDSLLIFPAASPRAPLTLSLYLSAGGTLQDSQGRLALDETLLADALSVYTPFVENGLLPPTLPDYQNDDQTWAAFRELRGNLVVNWASRFLQEQTLPLAFAPLPGLDAGRYTLATGWSWALAGSNPDNQPLAVELAEFLSDSQFLAEWNQTAGYLPTRPTALASWSDAREQIILMNAAESANLLPGEDVLVTVGPLFTEATLAVIQGEKLPLEAAQSVIEQIK